MLLGARGMGAAGSHPVRAAGAEGTGNSVSERAWQIKWPLLSRKLTGKERSASPDLLN